MAGPPAAPGMDLKGTNMNFRSLRYASMLAAALLLAGCIPELIADAGPDQTVSEGASVTLPAAANVLDHIVAYKWKQTAGPKVNFKVSKKGVLTFTAPSTEVQQKLTFELTVMYERGHKSVSDSVDVTVNQIKFFGTAAAGAQDYALLLNWFDQITPENAGKWGSVEATRDVMNWQALDDAYNFAKTNHLPFKFHTLIWGQQQPGWLASLPADQQLAEIEQWMAAVAARYPDIDFIDVVNEPLNNPAGYRDALGGAGTTGYDWVIKSFEMARAHFPKAKLHINEFNTVILPQFTDNYMTLVKLLQERNLIDGIGEQAHFLERADVPVVKANLDTLASTGLPIYISELDLNFADDARQANVMRDLFKVFWDHPSVGGITHWGFRQGATWQTNTWLVRTDGTPRPALDWITCYMGGGGDTCTVPVYVPAGWKGGEFGLTLEAELYDAGQGVAALGSVVAYTDGGDWIAFKNVELQQGWNKFWATYAKGNTDPGSISVHLDSLDATPLFTLDLPPTGSWGTAKTLEQDWPSLTGTHDVYIRFNGVTGIANLDNVRIGKPQPQSGVNLVTDGGFETGIAGWSSWNGATLAASNAQAHSGAQSLHATNRPNANQFAVYSLTSKVQTNTTYSVSAWALINGAGNGTVRLAVESGLRGRCRYLSLDAEQHGGRSGHMDAAVRKSGDSGNLHAHRRRDLLRGHRPRLRRLCRRCQSDSAQQQSRDRRRFRNRYCRLELMERRNACRKQCAGAHRQPEPARDEPSQCQSVRRLQPHRQGADQHHLQRQCVGPDQRNRQRHRASGVEGGVCRCCGYLPLDAKQYGSGAGHLDSARG